MFGLFGMYRATLFTWSMVFGSVVQPRVLCTVPVFPPIHVFRLPDSILGGHLRKMITIHLSAPVYQFYVAPTSCVSYYRVLLFRTLRDAQANGPQTIFYSVSPPYHRIKEVPIYPAITPVERMTLVGPYNVYSAFLDRNLIVVVNGASFDNSQLSRCERRILTVASALIQRVRVYSASRNS